MNGGGGVGGREWGAELSDYVSKHKVDRISDLIQNFASLSIRLFGAGGWGKGGREEGEKGRKA